MCISANKMRYLVFDDMTQCTEADVRRMLPLVDASRREQALRYRHVFGQWTCLKAAEMLLQMGISGPWLYNEFGKPYLPNGPHFSISHTRTGVAVAVSESAIGIDIETIRTPSDGLIERTMNAAEQTWIASQPDVAVAFTTLWTQKEAVLKLRGTGIMDDLHDVLQSPSTAPSQSPSECLTTIPNLSAGYILSLATFS